MDEDFGMVNELSLLALNIWKEVYVVLDSFLSFLRKYEKKNTHNILSLMLDWRFKNLRLISSHFVRIRINPQFDASYHIQVVFVFQFN
jgi:hypothetical protein